MPKKDELDVLTRFYATEVAGKSRVWAIERSHRILDLTDDARDKICWISAQIILKKLTSKFSRSTSAGSR